MVADAIEGAVRDAAVRAGMIDVALARFVDRTNVSVDERGRVIGAALAVRSLRDRLPRWFLDDATALGD